MSKKLFVRNLSWNVTSDELSRVFAEFGAIEEADVIMDRATNRSKGFGFVTFTNAEDADKATTELNGRELDGRELLIEEAKPREDKPNTYGARPARNNFGAPRRYNDNNRGGGNGSYDRKRSW